MLHESSSIDPGLALRKAAATGDLEKIKQADTRFINTKSSNGNTPLHWSIIRKHYAATKLLLTIKNIDIDAKNANGYTPLHLAAKNNYKKTVNRLLKQGAGYSNLLDNKGFSPLDYAYFGSYSFIVTKLILLRPVMSFKSKGALAEEAYKKFKLNNPDLIKDPQIFDPNYFFDEKITHYFSPGNRFTLKELKVAIKNKIINPYQLFCSGNLLQSAAVSRVETFDKFRWLLKIGVDPNLQSSYEINPSSYKDTVLHILIANESEQDAIEFVDLLTNPQLEKKFNFDLTDSEGKTALCLAVKIGLKSITKKLLVLNVDVNIPDEDGNTPLHYAFLLGQQDIVNELLGSHANKNAVNKENKTPYQWLVDSSEEDVRDCLETIWINPDRNFTENQTYIQYCMEQRLALAKNATDYQVSLSEITCLETF